MTTTWTLAIDWERTGTFVGTEDNITSYTLSANWFVGFDSQNFTTYMISAR